MARLERVRETVSAPVTLDYLSQRARAGWRLSALEWVREVNDRGFIDRVLALDAPGAIERATSDRSACSAGGAVASLCYARAAGAGRAEAEAASRPTATAGMAGRRAGMRILDGWRAGTLRIAARRAGT